MTNEEPLMVVKAGIDVVREVVRKNGHDSGYSMVRERETPLHHGGDWCVSKRSSHTKD